MARSTVGRKAAEPSLRERLAEFTRGEPADPEFLRECLWRLVDRTIELRRAARRDGVLIIVLVALFELLNRRLIAEAETGGLKFAKLDSVRFLVPVAVGYLVYRMFVATREANLVERITDEYVDLAFPKLARSRLLGALQTLGSNPIGSFLPDEYLAEKSRRLPNAIVNIEIGLVLLTPPAFEAYAATHVVRSRQCGELDLVGPGDGADRRRLRNSHVRQAQPARQRRPDRSAKPGRSAGEVQGTRTTELTQSTTLTSFQKATRSRTISASGFGSG